LRTGARVEGTIVFQNEDVVIVRDYEGARFQYPRADIAEILTQEVQAEVKDTVVAEEVKITKKATILLELAGGAAVRPNEKTGAGFSVDFLVGSHHIGDRHLFVGGGLGYHGLFIKGEKYNFLPIQAALRLPLMEQKHAPVFGASLGYGVALGKSYTGGLYAGMDFGYRCQLNPRTAMAVVFFAQFQQATMEIKQIVEDNPFTNKVGRNLVSTGVKLAFYL